MHTKRLHNCLLYKSMIKSVITEANVLISSTVQDNHTSSSMQIKERILLTRIIRQQSGPSYCQRFSQFQFILLVFISLDQSGKNVSFMGFSISIFRFFDFFLFKFDFQSHGLQKPQQKIKIWVQGSPDRGKINVIECDTNRIFTICQTIFSYFLLKRYLIPHPLF